MDEDLARALDALGHALVEAEALLGADAVADVAALIADARTRSGFLGRSTVVALAGGTGAGKSSLLNALAGEPIARTGVVRPTTDRPLAWIPERPEPGLVRLLDELGVVDRVARSDGAGLAGLAVLDLPDFDSYVADHRRMFEALLPRLDAVVWVLDPEKYNDRIVHEDFIRPHARHRDRFVFALNQVDRLGSDETDAVIEDLAATLRADGVRAPIIVPVAAAPPDGAPRGLDRLRSVLDERIARKRAAHGKLVTDLRWAGDELARRAGIDAAAIDLEGRWAEVRSETADRLARMVVPEGFERTMEAAGIRAAVASGAGPLGRIGAAVRRSRIGRALGAADPVRTIERAADPWAAPSAPEAYAPLQRFVSDVALEIGGAAGRRVRTEVGAGRLDDEVRAAVEGARVAVPPPSEPPPARWWPIAGVVQTLVLLAVLATVGWVWARPEVLDRGRTPWPLLVLGGAVVVGLVVRALVRRSGRRRGRSAAVAYRTALAEAIGDRLDARIGGPIRAEVARLRSLADHLDVARSALDGGVSSGASRPRAGAEGLRRPMPGRRAPHRRLPRR